MCHTYEIANSIILFTSCNNYDIIPPQPSNLCENHILYIRCAYANLNERSPMAKKDILFTNKNTIFAAVILFMLLSLIIIIGMLTPLLVKIFTGTELSLDSDYFNPRTAIPTALLIVTLAICLMIDSITTKAFKITALLFFLILGFASFFPFSNIKLSVSVALIVPALIATINKIWLTAKNKKGYWRNRGLSAHLIHLGILCVLLGVVLSSNMKVEDSAVYLIGENGTHNVKNYNVKINSMTSWFEGEAYQKYKASSYITRIDFDIYNQNKYVNSGSVKYITDFKWGQTYTTTYIHRGLTEELFIAPRALDEKNGKVDMYVRIVPFINFLWVGIYLMAMGIIALLIVEYRNISPSYRIADSCNIQKTISFFEKRYENIMEQEIIKLRSRKKQERQ